MKVLKKLKEYLDILMKFVKAIDFIKWINKVNHGDEFHLNNIHIFRIHFLRIDH